jgi:hypothetical protein
MVVAELVDKNEPNKNPDEKATPGRKNQSTTIQLLPP